MDSLAKLSRACWADYFLTASLSALSGVIYLPVVAVLERQRAGDTPVLHYRAKPN